ncbi:MAG: peptidoglycan synthetase FtsI [Rickettsiaceae bacterium]|jgi:cell division protein FtsI (penicillin-binding protein 3)|nr:peptidoglycan synthetase FtsI [Rickettsiaceae bacterium]
MFKETGFKNSRLNFLFFCFVVAFLGVSTRLVVVTLSGDKVSVSNFYDSNKNRKRANIIDRNGVIIATDLKAKSLYISNVLIKNPELVAKQLAEIFPELKAQDILKKISTRQNRNWVLIKRGVAPKEQELVQSLKTAGLIFDEDLVRVYPQKSILAHIVGYVDLDRKGLSGVEMQYDKSLKSGKDLQLAMDVRLQDVLSDELALGIEKYRALAASGIIMDVNNGEVLAIASQPNFDANRQMDASQNERFNRATYGVYELGSIFKIFTNAIAFEDNLVKMTDSYDVSEPVKYGRFTIKDDHPIKGSATVAEIFSHSSNIGTIAVAKKIGVERQKKMLERFGLLSRIESDFPALSKPIYPKTWREINLYTISYGHGIAVTPLHMATTVSAIVNGGVLHDPSFAKLEKSPRGKRIIKESTSETMRKMLREVVVNGTGKNADIEGFEVGGKTGTAERAEFGKYSEKKTMASFIAVFPVSKPQYLIFVSFDRPNYSFNTGGMVAAPVAGRVIKAIAPILGIKPANLGSAKNAIEEAVKVED